MSLVSILLPVRSNSPALSSVLNSILKQELEDWQLVVLLDRDTGINEALIKEMIPGEKLKIVQVNLQQIDFPSALNLGIHNCSADLIARQDDDDISMADRLRCQLAEFSKYPDLDISTGRARVVDYNSRTLRWINPPCSKTLLHLRLLSENCIAHSSVMYKKSSILKIGGYKTGMHSCEDYDLWLRSLGILKIKSSGHHLIDYFSNENGMARTNKIPLSSFYQLVISRKLALKRLNISTIPKLLTTLIWITHYRRFYVRLCRCK